MTAEMDDPLDKTTLATISLLESRLLRIEHLLYGTTASPFSSQNQHDSALDKMDALERRFSRMTSQIRVYAELLKICQFRPVYLMVLFSDHSHRQVESRSVPRPSALPATVPARRRGYPIHRPLLRIVIPRHALRSHRRQRHPHPRLFDQCDAHRPHPAHEGDGSDPARAGRRDFHSPK